MLNRFLDSFPPGLVTFLGGIYFIMPIWPEPHLVQKAGMLMNGVPLAPIDWFDVAAHSTGGILAVLAWRREREVKAMGGQQDANSKNDGDD